MQSGYGGVSEMQQFMVDGCTTSLFSISNSTSAPSSAEIQRFHQPTHPQALPPPPPPHFAHYGHPIPITQQLFHQAHGHHHHHSHQFQLFHHQQHQGHHHQHHMGLDQESGPENSNSPARMMGAASGGPGGGGGPSFLAAMNFKLGVDESSGGRGSRDGLNDDDGMLQGDDGSESRLHHSWHREDDQPPSAANIKEPFWRPLDIDYINPNNKRAAKQKQPEISSSNAKHFKKSSDSLDHSQTGHNNTNAAAAAATDSNYKLFSELEAIYKPGGTPSGGGVGGANNQTGSGSALTGDDNPFIPANAPGPTVEHCVQPDNVSDTSNGAAAGNSSPAAEATANRGGARKKQRSKRRQQKNMASIATFFESLVKQLMDHQEELHRKFLDIMEKRDQERTSREDAWRKEEAARAAREAAARAQERAMAAAREAAIIAFLEKITGESLNLPTKAQFTEESSQKEHDADYNALEPYNADTANNNSAYGGGGGGMQLNSSRWPKAEVETLIRVRSGLESRFQEPGLKGPLWEEVSMGMASMGYQRSSKRCKEKWENINKYFRKTKDSGKKRPQHSKTCPYFHQLDQLYSKSPAPLAIADANAAAAAASTPSSSNANANEERNDNNNDNNNSELLDAIVVSNDHGGKGNAEFNNEEEGQGESQGSQAQHHDNLCEDEQFFHRIRS